MQQNHELVLVIIIVGKTCSRTITFEWHKRFWEGQADISDDFWSERLRISDSIKNVQISASRYNLELKFADRSAVAKFGVDFYKDVYS